MTRWISEVTLPKPMRFVIMYDKLAGYYIYSYDNGVLIRDDLQDTLEIAQRTPVRLFGVTIDQWMPLEQPYEWVAEVMEPRHLQLRIVHDLVMGFYVLVKEPDRNFGLSIDKMGSDWRKWLKTFDEIKAYCFEKYHVPLDAWREDAR